MYNNNANEGNMASGVPENDHNKAGMAPHISENSQNEGVKDTEMSENDQNKGLKEPEMSEFDKTKGNTRFVFEMANGQSVKDASAAAGFSTRTGFRRMQQQEWHNAVQEMRALMIEQALEFVASNLVDALNTIAKLKETGDSDSVKLRAAKTVLDFAAKEMKQVEVKALDEQPAKPVKPDLSDFTRDELDTYLLLVDKIKYIQEEEGDDD